MWLLQRLQRHERLPSPHRPYRAPSPRTPSGPRWRTWRPAPCPTPTGLEWREEGGGGRVAAILDSLDAEEQDQFVAVLSRICREYSERQEEKAEKKAAKQREKGKGKKQQ